MGLFEKLFGKAPKPRGKPAGDFKMLNGYTPHFSTWGGSIYESEIVRASINAVATHCSKLQVSVEGSAQPTLQTRLRRAPNSWQTWSQFLYRLATILYIHNTAFITPVFDDYGVVTGVYALLPEHCDVVAFGEGKTPYLRYRFSWGETAAIELQRCGVMTRHQYRDDLTGESNRALLPTMDLISMQNQGIKEGVKNSAAYRFMAKATNFIQPEDMPRERRRFSELNLSRDSGGGGLLLFPNTYTDIKQIEAKQYVVDADQMQLINESVYQYFGVNEDVLTNKAYGDAWAAFYEGAIEPFAVQLSEVLTKMLFTPREQAQGSYVMATSNRLQYMTNADKLAVAAQLTDRGVFSVNEAREVFNLPPVEGGDVRTIRGEYKNADEIGGADGAKINTAEA